MALWMKKEDGTLVEVSGGGGGTFDGEHVPTGDPTDPATLDIVDEGQLLFDGVEDTGGSSGDGVAWDSLYEAFYESGPFEFSTNNAFSLDTADDEVAAAAAPGPVEPPLVRTWTNTNSFDVVFRIEYQGFVYGSGSRTSYTKIVLRGDGTSDAVSPTCRNWGGTADETTEVHQGVTGFATCKVEAGATVTWELEAYENLEGSFHSLKWLGFAMSCVPLDSTILAGGSGGAGPHDHAEYAPVEHDHDEFTHDHDYLPLSGGTVTGDLTLDGTINTDSIAAPPKTELSIVSEKGLRLDSGDRDHQGKEYPFTLVGPLVEMTEDAKINRSLRVDSSVSVGADLTVETHASIGGAVVQGFFCSVAAHSAEYVEWPSTVAFGQIQLAGNTVSTTGSALLHYRSNQGYTVESGKRLRTTDGTSFQDAGDEMIGNTVAPTGTTYPDGHITVVPNETGGKYRLYIENNTDADRSWVGMWMGTAPITGGSSGVSRSAADVKELSTRIEELEGA